MDRISILNSRGETGKDLAESLKGGVIMDVTTPSRHKLLKRQVPVQ